MENPEVTEDESKHSRPTIVARVAGSALPSLVALFLGAITVGVLGAEVSGPPIFGFLIRAFFGLVVGGIALWMVAVAVHTLSGFQRGSPRSEAQLPTSISALCPACGRAASDAQWCPFCEFPLGGRLEAWRPEDRNWVMNLFLLCLGAGLLCLGVFVGVGPLLDGEGRLWAEIAFVALGLLIAGVGALLLWGGGLVALDDLRGITRWSYRSKLDLAGASYSVSGTAIVARSRLVHAHGSATMELSSGALRSARKSPHLVPAQQAFARALSFLHHRGHVALWWTRAIRWSIGAPFKESLFRRVVLASTDSAAKTNMNMQLMMRFLASIPDDAAGPLLEALTPMAKGATPVVALWRTCRDSGADLGRLHSQPAESVTSGQDCLVAERAVATEICGDVLN